MADVPKWEDTTEIQPIVPSMEEATAPTPDISQLESGLRGTGQGLTFGFGDEIIGGVQALINAPGSDESLTDLYTRYRDVQRAQEQAAREANPITYGASEIGSGFLIPGGIIGKAAQKGASLGSMMKSGAAMGALSGLGSSEASLTEEPEQAALDIGIGTGLGAVGGAVGKGISKLAQAPKESQLAQDVTESFMRGRRGENLTSKDARLLITEKFDKQVTSLKDKIDDVEEGLKKQYEKAYSAVEGQNIKAKAEPKLQDYKNKLLKLQEANTDSSRKLEIQKLIDKIDDTMLGTIEKTAVGELRTGRESLSAEQLKNLAESLSAHTDLLAKDPSKADFKQLSNETGIAVKNIKEVLSDILGTKDLNKSYSSLAKAKDIMGRTSELHTAAKIKDQAKFMKLINDLNEGGMKQVTAQKLLGETFENLEQAGVPGLEKIKPELADISRQYELSTMTSKEPMGQLLGSRKTIGVKAANILGRSPVGGALEATTRAITSPKMAGLAGAIGVTEPKLFTTNKDYPLKAETVIRNIIQSNDQSLIPVAVKLQKAEESGDERKKAQAEFILQSSPQGQRILKQSLEETQE